jgi:glycosyltransferase involved in cell wall biosynthesis
LIILQVSPEFSPGTGVGGVAWALESRWRELGHDVRRFGLQEAGCAFLDRPGAGLQGHLVHAARVVWFSTVGTLRARRVARRLPPGSVTVCHNDALAGDVYINHGVLTTAMRARGRYAWRMVRNPLHLFTALRDRYRYGAGIHRFVVSLSEADRATLIEGYGLDAQRAVVISNGVHLDRFRLPTPRERADARAALGIPQGARVAVFVGHEFERKGLSLLLRALPDLPDHHAVVVGGTPGQVQTARQTVPAPTADRVHWLGRVADPRPALVAGDVLVLPSAYEANPLVVLEALATGLQVVATPVGSVPDVLVDDEVSRIVPRTVDGVRSGLAGLAAVPLPDDQVRVAARNRAETVGWDRVARTYLELFERLLPEGASQR